ncbi:hypothetical protein A3B40_00975 [Candidatus Roizmanbacteria bacterium RIFCSPLOWO2_01_FULL_37_16]|uniref:2'-5' RNA ligase n=1 Tax=Candidatus Roizmanbacteria bacterium RIFCSPLOWO2_01_FULL_37_16 TaxID=1802058 RepID=A0A1F7IJ74_9BACT|nr:MAG: hypothetical protein A2859_02545 [Candidatus Roizmanbacteria bacterium RIFCSPHIGHO2_01_FULL_37_16b]OGK33835.1 MAG: hypothetical protein A3F57_06405 [Candidatus Roizmanbacteria bacterium RIFCSPHIGHO2_12_FULL_36_11]OGK43394.1 MAG: hypothetical protein A3B40_00975 [Candidatus Roizmanbacteria bacterium RIFCSPLOWO2_01_FULL_37_16]
METIRDLNVVIIPDDWFSVKLINWSRLVSAKYKTNFTLERGKYCPHISLYQTRYPQKNFARINSQVEKIAAAFTPFQISLNGFSKNWGFIFYDVEPNEVLQRLHESIVDALNPLRNNFIPDSQLRLTGLTAKQKNSIEKYGHVFVKKTYVPHLSITNLVNPPEISKAMSILPKKTIKFNVTGLSLGSVSEYGTCPKIFKKFPFKR